MSKSKKIAALLDEKINWTHRCLKYAIKQNQDDKVQEYYIKYSTLSKLRQELENMDLIK